MMNYKKQKMIKVPDQKVEIDPRSKTTADGAFNYIAKPEVVGVNGTKRMRSDKRKNSYRSLIMAWFSLAKIALQAGSKIYSNRQKTKMAMSDAQLMHAEKAWLEVKRLTRANFLKQGNRTGKTNLC